MINVSVENRNFEIDTENLAQTLTDLEFVFADLYIYMLLEKGFSNKDIDDLFELVKEKAYDKAWKIIKEAKGIDGSKLLKDVGIEREY